MEAVDILREGTSLALMISAPLLLLGMLVGGDWMPERLMDFTRYLFSLM